MKEKVFYITLAVISAMTGIGLYILVGQELFRPFKALFVIAYLFFVLLTIVLYYVSKRAAVHRNRMLFVYVMMFAILVKFGFCLIALFIYSRVYKPETNLYILPFIAIYVIYTIFETYFMMKLGKIKPQNAG